MWTFPFVNLDSNIYATKPDVVLNGSVNQSDGNPALVEWWDGVGLSVDPTHDAGKQWSVLAKRRRRYIIDLSGS